MMHPNRHTRNVRPGSWVAHVAQQQQATRQQPRHLATIAMAVVLIGYGVIMAIPYTRGMVQTVVGNWVWSHTATAEQRIRTDYYNRMATMDSSLYARCAEQAKRYGISTADYIRQQIEGGVDFDEQQGR